MHLCVNGQLLTWVTAGFNVGWRLTGRCKLNKVNCVKTRWTEFFVVLHMYALFPPFHSLRLYNKKSFRWEFSQICISLFLGTVFCSGVFFVLMHEERWKYLPSLVPAFSCGFGASFSQKKTLCGWKTQILLCPPSAVLQHPALVIANKSCASCLCESSSCTRGKFNNDPSRNNGKPRRSRNVTQQRFSYVLWQWSSPWLVEPARPSASASAWQPSLRELQRSRPRDNTARHSCITLHTNRSYISRHPSPPPPSRRARLVWRCVPWRKASGKQGWSQRPYLWPGCGRDSEAAAGRSRQATGASGDARRASPPPPVDRGATSGGHWHAAGTLASAKCFHVCKRVENPRVKKVLGAKQNEKL